MGNPNNLELHQGDNFIFGVDVSASMQTADCPGGAQRIEFLKEKTIQFAREASKYDPDGIDVLAFGHQVTPYPNVTADRAADIIGALRANEGATMTHLLINKAWTMHKAGKYEQTVLFIATDGDPSDKEAVKFLNDSLRIDPNNKITVVFLAEAMVDKDEHTKPQAIQMLRDAVAKPVDPNYVVEQTAALNDAKNLLKKWGG